MISVRAEGVKPSPRIAGAVASRQIPFAFRADPVALDELRIDPTARQVFTLVLDNAKNRGWTSRLSNATIGRILGRCPMTISRALGRLEAAGLVRRELIAGGRVRTGIAVTWEGVQAQRLTGQAPVRREDLTGSARAPEGLGASVEQIRAPLQSRSSDGCDSLSTGGKEAADYLRRCVEAAKRGEPMPEPPTAKVGEVGGSSAVHGSPPQAEPIPPKGSNGIGTPAPTPTAPPDAFMPSIGRMVAALGERLKAEDVGRRRVGPKRLAAQLAEVRRRHGRSPR